MKLLQRILILTLVLALGTSTACSTSDTDATRNNGNNSGSLEDSGSSDKDVENTDDKDVDETDDKDVENTDGNDVNETDDKDVGETDDNDINETDDIDADDNDANENDANENDADDNTDVPPDPEEDKTPLKDLTDEQVIELCAIEDGKTNAFFTPSSNTAIAYCLIFAAEAAYDSDAEPADMIAQCQDSLSGCLSDDTPYDSGKCINQIGCKATVADYERCSDAHIAKLDAQVSSLIGKTCADYTTQQSYESLGNAIYEYPQECATLYSKCPNLQSF